MSLTTTFADLCKSFAPDAFAINYTLAKNPEISSQEFESVKTIGAVLEKYGMAVTYEFCNLPTAFKASAVKVDNPKGRLAILCEYDALPEVGHACGHSASGSMSVLAALTLHKMQEEGVAFNMDIDIIGTPDEEAMGLPLWCISTAKKRVLTHNSWHSTASVLSITVSQPMRPVSLGTVSMR